MYTNLNMLEMHALDLQEYQPRVLCLEVMIEEAGEGGAKTVLQSSN